MSAALRWGQQREAEILKQGGREKREPKRLDEIRDEHVQRLKAELARRSVKTTTQRSMHLSQAAPREGIAVLERGTQRALGRIVQEKGRGDA